MKILIIEDDAQLRQQLENGLTQFDFQTVSAGDGQEGLFLAQNYPIDLAIVDLGLPKMDGMSVIKSLRADEADFPILILTARGGWKAKVEGLESGADDYLEKPFHMEELVARIKALLRRVTGHQFILNAGPLSLNLEAQQALFNDSDLELTAFEYKILEYMMRRTGKVVSKSVLTDYLYDQDFDRDSNVIEVLVGRLRKKLNQDGSFNPIQTLRGRGYVFQWEKHA